MRVWGVCLLTMACDSFSGLGKHMHVGDPGNGPVVSNIIPQVQYVLKYEYE